VAIQLVLIGAIAVAGWRGHADPFGDGAGAWAVMVEFAGVALIALGGVVAVLGVIGLRENLTANPRPIEGGRLVDTGVYGLVRHPIYTGLIVAALGWALATTSPAALLLGGALALFFDTKARREEAWLAAAYPGYAAYRRRVRKLVPFVY
jgi:protein-S-isoprenylcysteine O-methyltransferase Ste14